MEEFFVLVVKKENKREESVLIFDRGMLSKYF